MSDLSPLLTAVAKAGFAADILRVLTAGKGLAHDKGLLSVLLLSTGKNSLEDVIISEAPLLQAAAAMGDVARVTELMQVAGIDDVCLMSRQTRQGGMSPLTSAANAGQSATLAVLLADARSTQAAINAEGVGHKHCGDGVVVTAFSTACMSAADNDPEELNRANCITAVLALLPTLMPAICEALGDAASLPRECITLVMKGPRVLSINIRFTDGFVTTDFDAGMNKEQAAAIAAALANMPQHRGPTATAAATCAGLLWATGAIDPGTHTGCGSAGMERKAAPKRAAVIRGARPTNLGWAAAAPSLRATLLPLMVADARCTSAAIKAHWIMGCKRPSAFWRMACAMGSSDYPCLENSIAWWQATLAGGASASAALPAAEQARVAAYHVLHAMASRLCASEMVVHRSAGPYDDVGHLVSAGEVLDELCFGEIAPFSWKAKQPQKSS